MTIASDANDDEPLSACEASRRASQDTHARHPGEARLEGARRASSHALRIYRRDVERLRMRCLCSEREAKAEGNGGDKTK